jgi:hypothetical protein
VQGGILKYLLEKKLGFFDINHEGSRRNYVEEAGCGPEIPNHSPGDYCA